MAYGAILGQTVTIPQPVDTVTSGNMNAVTSNAVYQALQNLPEGVQIATGSYVGTGTYGASNPNLLTFDFEPKLVIVQKNESNYNNYNRLIMQKGPTSFNNGASASNNDYTVTIKDWTNTISWYSSSDGGQLNYNSTSYYYVAIG